MVMISGIQQIIKPQNIGTMSVMKDGKLGRTVKKDENKKRWCHCDDAGGGGCGSGNDGKR